MCFLIFLIEKKTTKIKKSKNTSNLLNFRQFHRHFRIQREISVRTVGSKVHGSSFWKILVFIDFDYLFRKIFFIILGRISIFLISKSRIQSSGPISRPAPRNSASDGQIFVSKLLNGAELWSKHWPKKSSKNNFDTYFHIFDIQIKDSELGTYLPTCASKFHFGW